MDKNKCCICGIHIGSSNTYPLNFYGRTCNVCQYCSEAFNKIESDNPKKAESGRKYLQKNLENGNNAPELTSLIKDALGEIIPEEKLDEALEQLPEAKTEEKSESETNGKQASAAAPFFAGLCFLIFGIILFFVSVNNSYGVANIPSTVYCGASWVAAVVCFSTSTIIKAINSKK